MSQCPSILEKAFLRVISRNKVFTPQTPRFPNIVEHARALGVSRHHLYFVLKGERKSPTLTKRYHDLQKEAQ